MKEMTGRKVLMIWLGFFGTVMTVNFYMAAQAVGTFPGVVERQPYIASQTFDAERRAQTALGWEVSPVYDADAGVLRLSLRETETGLPSDVAELSALVGRPTHSEADRAPAFMRIGDDFVADASLEQGYWIVMLEATAQDGTRFRQRLRLFVRG